MYLTNLRRSLVHFARGAPPLEPGETREVSDEVVEEFMARQPGWFGTVVTTTAAPPEPVPKQARPPTRVEEAVRAEVASMVAVAMSRAAAADGGVVIVSGAESRPSGSDLSHLTAEEARATVAATSDDALLGRWAADGRRSVQRAVAARRAELARAGRE